MSQATTLLSLALALTGAVRADDGIPLAVVNLSARPVFATAVSLDAADLWNRLCVASNTPLLVRATDGGSAVPPFGLGDQNGRPALRIFLSLAPGQRMELAVQRAERWPEIGVEVARAPDQGRGVGELRNGIVRVTFTNGVWSLGFDSTLSGHLAPVQMPARKGVPDGWEAGAPLLIEGARTDFWIDRERRGRLLNEDPARLGLVPYTRADMLRSEAFIGPDGQPTFCVERRMAGWATNMTVREQYELVPGLPLLLYRIRWRNDGDVPLWVAYVGSGDGVKGRWSPELMPVPLVERQKSALQGDINGAETRPAWLPGLCRVSMESPATGCGVGLSTLLRNGPVGQGSMVWMLSGSGFQCNFIDPVQGQFPFEVPAHGFLDNGFAFLASAADVGIYRQTEAAWSALRDGRLPDLPPTCAVYLDGRPIHAQAVTGWADPTGTEREVALRLDFNRHFDLQLDVEAASPEAPIRVMARTLPAGRDAVELLRAERPGIHRVYLNKQFAAKKETDLSLSLSTEGTARPRRWAVVETLPEAPVVLSPVADAEITDWAAMFRWKAVPLVMDYRIQMARDPDFAQPVEMAVQSSQTSPWYLVPDDRLPAPGVWHWRIRGEKGPLTGAWSEARRLTVNDEHTTRPLRRPLTEQNPLFTLEATWISDFTAFKPDIPPDLAPSVAILAEGMERSGKPVTEFTRGMERMPYAFLLRGHQVSLADYEWLFRHVPNFVGVQSGEHLSWLYNGSADMRYTHRLVKLCAKYGMFFHEADGTYKDDKWQLLMDRQGEFVRTYGPWLVLSQKNNIIRRQFYSQSAAMGLWLGGLTHHHGAWEDGGFYWQNAGFSGLGVCRGERSGSLATMPRIFWALNMVMGIGRGCGIYSLDGQTLMQGEKILARDPKSAWPSALWYDSGRTSDAFRRFIVPLVRATVDRGLIPSKDEVLKQIRLAVFNDMKGHGDETVWTHYAEYGPLYAGTYGFRRMGTIDGQLWEFFPNTGRYYFVPVLPQGDQPLGPGVRNLPVSKLQNRSEVAAIFGATYPQTYEGAALVLQVGETLAILNSHENTDEAQSYTVSLGGRGGVDVLSGRIEPHSYVLGKVGEDGLWLQANTEYPMRNTRMSFTMSEAPQVIVKPASAAVVNRWDASAKRFDLALSHADGAVEVEVIGKR